MSETSSEPSRVALPPLSDEQVVALGEGRPLLFEGVLGREAAIAAHAALARLRAEGRMQPAAVGRGVEREHAPEIRGDHMAWLDEVDERVALWPLWDVFEDLMAEVNAAAWMGLTRFEVQVACYPGDGARYLGHRDAFLGDHNRKLTAIWYANPLWRPEHGGLLRVWPPGEDGHQDIEPRLDRLLVFRSDVLLHEVLPTFAPRYAVTAWFRGRESVPL
ncbi:MAG: 2OG-Fe(II) oxygenase [Alphaproteobacteria bacterium]|nr:2OG-Fe(II) oxygenase [Alphaproteobacteria bacterium]